MNQSISDILKLPDGTALDSVQGTITAVYDQRTVRGGKSVQDAKIKDGSGAEIKLSIWEHPDCSMYQGREVIINSGPQSKLKVVFDGYKQRNVNTLSVSGKCTFQFLEVHHAQNGQAPTPAQAAQQGAGTRGSVAPQAPNIVVNGAKIGMALNNAVLFMTAAGEPFNEDELWEMASKIIHLSNKMEKGELAELVKEAAPF